MVIFYYGPNTYELQGQVRHLVETYVAKAGSDFGLERIDGTAIKPRELQGALQASPFLANSRLVVVEGLALNKAIGEQLPAIMAAVPKTTVALFADREVDQRTTVFRQLAKADKVVKFEVLTGSKLSAWARAEVEKLGGTLADGALSELLDAGGDDQWRLAGEINKLINFNTVISVESVRMLVARSIEQSIFELVEAMTRGDLGAALAGYRRLLEQKESAMYVLTMVQWQLRNLLLAKTAPAVMSPPELAKAASMSPYVAGKMISAQGRLDEAVLKAGYMAAADCEFDIKSGRQKMESAVEQLIYRVARSVRPG